MALITETHTTDLMASCQKSVQLRHEGKIVRLATSALYKGLLFHEAALSIHSQNGWGEAGKHTLAAVDHVAEQLHAEQRPLSEAVKAGHEAIVAEVCELVDLYVDRFREKFAKCELIGTELPIRLALPIDGEDEQYASHIDLLFRDENGILNIWDLKTGQTSPSRAFLSRNLQLGLYHLAVLMGRVMIDGEWTALNEQAPVAWIHADHLWPFTRRTETEDENGVKTAYVKGDRRPVDAIVREVLITDIAAITSEMETRARMFRAGLFPTNPDETGCLLCESRKWCPNWEGDPTSSSGADR